MDLIADPDTENSVCIVAILKDEERFVEEWVAYHLLVGVSYFILFDNSNSSTLQEILLPYRQFVRIIPWSDSAIPAVRANKQIDAYNHSLQLVTQKWIAFLDGDEYLVLNKHPKLSEFLGEQKDASSVFLAWCIFGHSGYYEDPPGLISEHLVRRRFRPSKQGKSITLRSAILSIESAHTCRLKPGCKAVSAQIRKPHGLESSSMVPIANINHYQCRSFETWMRRVSRGSAHLVEGKPVADENLWRLTSDSCLREFVAQTKDSNEWIDTRLRAYSESIRALISEKRNSYRDFVLL